MKSLNILTTIVLMFGYVIQIRASAVQATVNLDKKSQSYVTLVTPTLRLETILEALRAQTHLDIRAEDCLRDRMIMVSLDHVTIENALLAIAELNNWQLTRGDAGQLRLSRKRAPAMPDIAQLQQSLRNAIPVDVQTYAGYRERATIELVADSPIASLLAGPGHVNTFRLRKDQTSSIQSKLYIEIKRHFPVKKPVRYAKLSTDQRDMLLHIILLSLSREVWEDPLMVNPIPPNLLDPRQTAVFLQGNILNHGYALKTDSGYAFLGDGEPINP